MRSRREPGEQSAIQLQRSRAALRSIARERLGGGADRSARRAFHERDRGLRGREALPSGGRYGRNGQRVAEERPSAAPRDHHSAESDPPSHASPRQSAAGAAIGAPGNGFAGAHAGGVQRERAGGHRVRLRHHAGLRVARRGAESGVPPRRARSHHHAGRRQRRSLRRVGGRRAKPQRSRAAAAGRSESAARSARGAGAGGRAAASELRTAARKAAGGAARAGPTGAGAAQHGGAGAKQRRRVDAIGGREGGENEGNRGAAKLVGGSEGRRKARRGAFEGIGGEGAGNESGGSE